MTIWMIINIVLIVLQVIILINFVTAINYFKEIIVRFVEVNQENFKNQKHLTMKIQENLEQTKKVSSQVATMKRLTNRLNDITNKMK